MDFLKEIVKEIGDDDTKLASDIDDTEKYVDTGSYIFNGLVSGSIFGGVSGNKITAIAGESSTGKTFFSLAVVKNFLDSNPDGYCLYFDTEAAVNKSLLTDRGLDLNRVVVSNVVTVEQFRSQALRAVDMYLKKPEDERKPVMVVLDSLGMLSTEKEIKDAFEFGSFNFAKESLAILDNLQRAKLAIKNDEVLKNTNHCNFHIQVS